MTSSIIVVEIDSRSAYANTVFESTDDSRKEQAKQFWKTLSLAPHIESSLYSKEILQQVKTNPLLPMTIDNTRKVPQPDPREEKYMKALNALNEIDQINMIQRKAAKIGDIKKLHQVNREKFSKMNNISKTALIKSESESKWNSMTSANNNKYLHQSYDDYEILEDNLNDLEMVKKLEL